MVVRIVGLGDGLDVGLSVGSFVGALEGRAVTTRGRPVVLGRG